MNDLKLQLYQAIAADDENTADSLAVLIGQAGEASLHIAESMLSSDVLDHQFWAIRILWANSSPLAIIRLIRLLQAEDVLIRSGSALALGEMKAVESIELLADCMMEDESEAGNHAADALAKIGIASCAALVRGLQHHYAFVRVRAAKALIPIECKAAIRPLIQALDFDESYIVRHYADEALKRMGVGQMVYFK